MLSDHQVYRLIPMNINEEIFQGDCIQGYICSGSLIEDSDSEQYRV